MIPCGAKPPHHRARLRRPGRQRLRGNPAGRAASSTLPGAGSPSSWSLHYPEEAPRAFFRRELAPFIMELPQYHLAQSVKNALACHVRERVLAPR
ncbi:MAG: hypothetical protein ACLTDR_04880 [Adlercreutzia equolifaciens]